MSRKDGGQLIVNPPREVWERGELTAVELTLWSLLVAATGTARLDVLPQLEGGCINYWEAGNWALNERAIPAGPKTAREHRRVHLHLLGRSRFATHPSWKWGEAPRFPDYVDRDAWAATFEPLSPEECRAVTARMKTLLEARYGFGPGQIMPWTPCPACGYPTPGPAESTDKRCPDCRRQEP